MWTVLALQDILYSLINKNVCPIKLQNMYVYIYVIYVVKIISTGGHFFSYLLLVNELYELNVFKLCNTLLKINKIYRKVIFFFFFLILWSVRFQKMRDCFEVNAGRVQIRSSQTGFHANNERSGGCVWEGNLISHRLESNWS